MDVEEYCRFFAKLTRIPVQVAEERAALKEFCTQSRFHRIQDHFYPDVLWNLLDHVEERQIVTLHDDLQIQLLLCRALGKAVVVGPFCSESLSSLDARILLERCGISRDRAQDLLAYRARFPTAQEKEVLRGVRILVSHLTGADQLPPVRSIRFQNPPQAGQEEAVDRPYADTVSERYAVETDMMRAIEHGNALQALQDWRQLHQRMDYLKKQLGYTLDNARYSAAVTRTVIRVAGMNAGVPAHILDDLTGKASRSNRQARSLDEIEAVTETLIRDLCREIRRRGREGSGYLVESVKYLMDTNFAQDLTVAQVAQRLDVPESRLIERFRLETGITPGAYLRTVRMTKAADLLTGTRWSIQRIASEVGIPDANYFVKLFKREHGLTPTAYRKRQGRMQTDAKA